MTAQQRTHVDWWAFRTRAEVAPLQSELQRAFGRLGEHVRLLPRRTGWQGYEQSAEIHLADMRVGLCAYGGERQRSWVYCSISGEGCRWVNDWEEAQDRCASLDAYELRRVDLALDTVGQEVCHDTVVKAYRQGGFTRGGRPPKCTRLEPERPEDGRTVYVGGRENDVFLRGYEKGRQLVAGTDITHIDGVPVEDMYRLELELKSRSGALPTDLIDRRDQYFAGAYPYLQHVLHEVHPEIMVIDRRVPPMLELDAALGHIRRQWGDTLFTALVVKHGDIGAVWEKICGKQHNERLLRAGALMGALE